MSHTSVTVVRAGKLLDVHTREVLRDQAITIEGDRIAGVQSWTPAHADGTVVDWSDFLVAPGLVDLHTHLIGELGHGSLLPLAQTSPAMQALQGVRNAATTLNAGFTTVRDLGTYRAFVDRDLRDAINAGIVPGPRMHVAGAFVTTSTGGGELTGLEPDIELPESLRFGVADTTDEGRRAVRRIIHAGADVIKVMATGAVLTEGNIPGAPEFSESELRAIVEEAALNGVHVAAHAHGSEGIRRALRAGARSIEHGTSISPEVIDCFLETNAFYVPTVFLLTWLRGRDEFEQYSASTQRKFRDIEQGAFDGLRDAFESGVRIAYGTDAIVYPHGLNASQLCDFVAAGMKPMEALLSATVVAAECLDDPNVGAIEPERYADLVALHPDVLTHIEYATDVGGVIKGGAVVR